MGMADQTTQFVALSIKQSQAKTLSLFQNHDNSA